MADTIISTTITSDPFLFGGNNTLTITATGVLNTTGAWIDGGNNRIDIAAGGMAIGTAPGTVLGLLDFASAAPTGNITTNAGTISSVSLNSDGIFMETGGSMIVNSGLIDVVGTGVVLVDNPFVGAGTDARSGLINSGTIRAIKPLDSVGIRVSDDDAVIRNLDTGIISGGRFGINMSAADGAVLVNRGTISGGESAIVGSADDLRIVTSGTVTGVRYSVDVISDGGFFRNESTLSQEVQFGGDGAEFRNLGTISANVTLVFDTIDDINGVTFVNRGTGSVTGQINGSRGDDAIIGAGFGGAVHGNDGDDTIRGGAGNDTFYGGTGSDYIQGRSGNDVLDGDGGTSESGVAGNDTLLGNAGNDTMIGGTGADVLNGGKGDDSMTGGADADSFVIRRVGNGDDVITDFQNGTDEIDLSALSLADYSAISGTVGALSESNGALVIDLDLLGGSGSLTVTGLTLATVDATDFAF